MPDNITPHNSTPFLNGWRIAGWGAALALLCLPAIAMQFSAEVDWTPFDFGFAAILLLALGIGIELAARIRERRRALAAGFMALAGFATVWINAAVGIIGHEANPLNLAFPVIVLGVATIAAVTRFRRDVMLALGAAAMLAVVGTGLAAELTGRPDWGPVLFVAGLWTAPTALCWLARPSAA